MGLSVTEKILKEHLVNGELQPGRETAVRIDQTLTQDATGTMVYLQFEAMGVKRIQSELAVSYVDHNTVQVGPENADDHAFLRSAAAKYGAIFSRPGNGICHQLHLERFGIPGKTLLGSDSHTPTAGGLGMIAIGAGGVDVAMAMAGNPFYLHAPRVTKIRLTGTLKPWVAAKDIALKILEMFSTKGNVGSVFEYGGPGIRSLEVPARATIANMGAECGVTTSVFPSDEVTRRFLDAQGRGRVWHEIVADSGAEYDQEVTIKLSDLEPLAATPHSPGNVATIGSLVGTKVDQVLIGSCTNSSCRDLKTAAKILDGRKIHADVSLGIAPGSRQALAMLARDGLVTTLLEAGARILESSCGFCIGNSLSPGTNEVSLRTSNRNFEGRSGTQSARVFLVSPETAAVAALHGRIMDPRSLGDLQYPRVRQPKVFDIEDSMFVRPPDEGSSVKIVRGPNIGTIPRNEPLPDALAGVSTTKVGDRITTDDIMPAGWRLKYRSNVAAYSRFVFEGIDPEFAEWAARKRDEGLHNFIIAGESYGQGSSREHAALCPMFLGVKAVVAKSFERIHLANLINFGIVPMVFERPADSEKISKGDSLRIEGIRDAVAGNGRAILSNVTGRVEIPVRTDLSERQKKIVLQGGLLNWMTGGLGAS